MSANPALGASRTLHIKGEVHQLHLTWKIRGDLNPEMHLITGNIEVAVQDQPIADLSARALVPMPRSLRIPTAWEASQDERERFEGTSSKSC